MFKVNDDIFADADGIKTFYVSALKTSLLK